MHGHRWAFWLSWSLAFTLFLEFGQAAQARGGGGSHISTNGSHGSSVSAKSSGNTSSWRTHIHPNYPAASAKKTKKPVIHDITVTKKVDTSSPVMSSKSGGTFKPNKNRADPYKNYNFR